MERKLTVGSLIKNRYVIEIKSTVEETRTAEPKKEKRKLFIRLKQNNRPFQVEPVSEMLLLDCALQQNVPLEYKCRKGTCGKCTVEVTEGQHLLHPPNEAELKKSHADNIRLACQAKIK